MSTLSVFAGGAHPGVLTLYGDGAPGVTLGQEFTTYGGLAASGGQCIGARVRIPSTNPPHTDTVTLMAWLGANMSAAPDRTKTVPVNAGWTEGLWDTPLPMPVDGSRILIGYQFSGSVFGPNNYVHTPALRGSAAAIQAPGDVGLALAAAPSTYLLVNGSQNPQPFAIGYGIDILVETASTPPPNDPPVARAGADRVVASGASVTISGSTSTDADGTVAAYTWAQTAGPAVVLAGTGAARTFTAPDGPASLTFRLTVTDDDGATSEDTVVVVVSAPPAPLPPPSGGLLTEEDLAYMRETQTSTRPTAATLQARSEVPDGMGGTTTGAAGDPQPIQVRVAQADQVPEVLADRYGVGVVTVTMDLVPVQAGDAITMSPTEAYEVVSDGAIGAWTTAQRVLAVRTVWPPAGA